MAIRQAGLESLQGYGVIRLCGEGYKIGPLYADDRDTARKLYMALVAAVGEGEQVFFDVPEENREAVALAESFGMRVVFETARMYKRGTKRAAPESPVARIFGVTSFEIG